MLALRSSKVSSKWTLLHNSVLKHSTSVQEKCPYGGKPPKDAEVKKVKPLSPSDELFKARPMSEMPGPSTFHLISNTILPSGKYYKAGLKQIHQKLNQEYGSVVSFPGMFGRSPMVFVYDANDVETVFRNEGRWPDRRSFEFMQEYRKKFQPALFKESGGLLQE